MKKMMFNDRYGLTEAVLQGRKTVTRREVKVECEFEILRNYGSHIVIKNPTTLVKVKILSPYKIGEIVAVAQSYNSFTPQIDWNAVDRLALTKGWTNKMFVSSNLMPHQIRILDVRAERLQDINEKDCLREYPECDTIRERHINKVISMEASVVDNWMTRRDVFAWLIDKISDKGTWESNPYVWRIEFELIKQ